MIHCIRATVALLLSPSGSTFRPGKARPLVCPAGSPAGKKRVLRAGDEWQRGAGSQGRPALHELSSRTIPRPARTQLHSNRTALRRARTALRWFRTPPEFFRTGRPDDETARARAEGSSRRFRTGRSNFRTTDRRIETACLDFRTGKFGFETPLRSFRTPLPWEGTDFRRIETGSRPSTAPRACGPGASSRRRAPARRALLAPSPGPAP